MNAIRGDSTTQCFFFLFPLFPVICLTVMVFFPPDCVEIDDIKWLIKDKWC